MIHPTKCGFRPRLRVTHPEANFELTLGDMLTRLDEEIAEVAFRAHLLRLPPTNRRALFDEASSLDTQTDDLRLLYCALSRLESALGADYLVSDLSAADIERQFAAIEGEMIVEEPPR